MAKKPDQERPSASAGGTSRADQLRAAVEGAFGATTQGAAPMQKRAQELADELVGVAARVREALVGDDPGAVAGRVREAVEGLRPPSPEQLDALRAQVDALEARVAQLEAEARAPAKRSGSATKQQPAAAAKPTAARRRPAGGQRP